MANHALKPSDEADRKGIHLAREQGDAIGRTVRHMIEDIAEGGEEKQVGEYLVAYAVEKAEGLYVPRGGELEWVEPEEENIHIEVAVREAGDGRFVPGLTVVVTVFDDRGREVGTHEHPLLWHPYLYHYGRNWTVPGDGSYRLRVRIDPAPFPRHDRKNGKRFAQTTECEFDNVRIKTGQD